MRFAEQDHVVSDADAELAHASTRVPSNPSEAEETPQAVLNVHKFPFLELRQLDGLTLDKRFVDKASGKDLHRPQLEQLTGYVRDGDTVICHSMDWLARSLDDLRKIVLGFTERGVNLRFEKENLTFTGQDSPVSHLLLSVMGAFAQFERDLIRERQREGSHWRSCGKEHTLDGSIL